MSNAGPGTTVLVTEPLRVKIVPIPTKTIFYYPTFILAGLMAILTAAFPENANTFGQIFLFHRVHQRHRRDLRIPPCGDHHRHHDGRGGHPWTLSSQPKHEFLSRRSPSSSAIWKSHATWQFYAIVCIGGVLLIAGMLFMTRFDYWELTPNEFIHHHGLLGDVERFATNAMRFNKEITDIFEYFILRSATLHVTLPSQPKPITLDNVLFIGHVMNVANQILEGGKVVREDVIQHDHTNAHGTAAAYTQDQ